VRHIIADLPHELAWELHAQVPFGNDELPEDEQLEEDVGRPVFWVADKKGNPLYDAEDEQVGFVFYFLKRKWFKFGQLKHPDDPGRWYKKKGGIDYKHPGLMVIDDTVSHFQTSFLSAMAGMSSSITVGPDDQALIEWGKPLRAWRFCQSAN